MPRLREQIKETIEGDKFSIGDVVRLKSGGPQMTVMEVNRTRVACIWYREVWIDDSSEHYPTRILDEAVLELSPLSTAAI